MRTHVSVEVKNVDIIADIRPQRRTWMMSGREPLTTTRILLKVTSENHCDPAKGTGCRPNASKGSAQQGQVFMLFQTEELSIRAWASSMLHTIHHRDRHGRWNNKTASELPSCHTGAHKLRKREVRRVGVHRDIYLCLFIAHQRVRIETQPMCNIFS